MLYQQAKQGDYMAKIKYAIIDDGGMLNGKLFAYADDEQKLVAEYDKMWTLAPFTYPLISSRRKMTIVSFDDAMKICDNQTPDHVFESAGVVVEK